MGEHSARERIVILGSGMASLATAFELTSAPDWRDRYDITIYQMGWRAGGKGASGRNAAHGERIEEHGLHVWFGCYDNAFRVLDACYRQIARPAQAAFPTMWDAFKAGDSAPYMECVDGEWKVWPMWMPPNPHVPGTPGPVRTPWDDLVMLTEFVEHVAASWCSHAPEQVVATTGPAPDWLTPPVPSSSAPAADTWGHRLGRFVRSLAPAADAHAPEDHDNVRTLAGRCADWFVTHLKALVHESDELRRMSIVADLALAAIRGMVADGVIAHGYSTIDGEDLRAWLGRHGASVTALQSAPIRALYDMCFAYEEGDLSRPNFAAGTTLNICIRMASDYKGHFLYEMRAGMGDVVIAPIYMALRLRGVRFRFFHRVRQLALSADRTSVGEIRLGRQATLIGEEYEPLVDVRGLPCWPSEPLYDQLAEGNALRGVDLESKWNGWPDLETVTLRAGRDFDRVVLGISINELKTICADLAADSPRWRDMLERVRTVQTQNIQLWLTNTLEELGWSGGAIPIDAAPEPLDVWADRSEVIEREAWSAPLIPRSIQYLCGPLPGDFTSRPADDHAVPDEARNAVRDAATAWLTRWARVVWPKTLGAGRDGFDWSLLLSSDRSGPERLGAQYLRANIEPSERYVLSVAGSSAYRLGADESGYSNLVLCGDWTRTVWNAGGIEAATCSGVNAARAITGVTGSGPSVARPTAAAPARPTANI